MDIGIFPSLYGEGVPKSMLDAVSFGCPIITSNIHGCLEFSHNERNSILVDPSNSNQILEAILFLGKNYSKREASPRMCRFASSVGLSAPVVVLLKSLFDLF